MLDFDVFKDLIEMVMDEDTEVVDVQAGRKLSKEEVKEFLEGLCEDVDEIEFDTEEDSDDEKEELDELSKSTKEIVEKDRREYGEKYVKDKVDLADCMTKIAFAMDNSLPIRMVEVDKYNELVKKMFPASSYPEYVSKRYEAVAKALESARKEIGL